MTRLADQAARDRIRDDLDTTLVVEAAAGTGKTTELVKRMVALLTAGRARLDHMVAVTFTDAAAGELKLRLRKAIEDARRARPARALDDALSQLEEARIGTIHSFCADLLRERPVEAGVDPLFAVAPRDVAERLLDRAFDRWFEERLAAPGAAVRRILRRRTGDDGPRGLLRNAARELVERRDFPTPWRHADGFDRDRAIDALVTEMAALGEFAAAGEPNDHFVRSLVEIRRFVDELRRREAIQGTRDRDRLEAELGALAREKHWKWTGFRRVAGTFPKGELLERRARLRADLDDFLRRSGADLAPRLRDELWPVVESYEALKRRAGCLDFLDLLLRARDLVRNHDGVRAALQQRFTHVFVDEFQDTDPLQAEILLLLAADDPGASDWRDVRPVAGKLFLVGDPKQSIYRFRRADVTLYERVKDQLRARGAAVVDLTVSFRAVPEIQEAVNAAFAPRMQATPRYVPLSPHRSGIATQPAIVALPVPAPYGDFGTIVDWRIDESLPDAIAAFIAWIIEKKWKVTERDRPGERVDVRARHICILFRRFRSYLTDVTRPYVRALEARHLPHLLVGGTSFHVREEVEAIRNALAAIERPEDELAVFATLRGPFFALGDGALLAFRETVGPLHPFRSVPADAPEALREVRTALDVLRTLHRGRNRRPIADTIGRLLDETRAHAGLATWPTGEQALANVTRLMDIARRAERTGVTSFRAFVEWLGEQAEHGEAGDAPIVEEGTEGVRMMTVHGAKGLEFPVVVLADLTCNETAREPQRWTDADRGLCVLKLAGCTPPELQEHAAEELAREAEEATRVLYVATTRARDLLVVPALGDGRYEGGWLSALDPVVYPPPERVHRPETREPPGCPVFGTEATPGRPDGVTPPPDAVAPGLHVPERGAHRVVWWDTTTLALDVQESVGLTQEKILAVDERGVRVEAGVRAHDAWQAERKRVRADGAVPSVAVRTATEQAASGAALPADVVVESVAASGPRPHGTRFGTLVHAVLAVVDLDADRAAIADVAGLQGRLLDATAEEVDAAVETVAGALAHPLVRRAARAASCRRECPVAVALDGGVLVEGVVDAAFLEDDAWTVVDFKTDVEIAGRLEEYARQVGLYVAAVARATGKPARGVLLRL